MEDFTKAFQNMASMEDLYHMETFALFINDSRFCNISVEDLVKALVGAAETGSIKCIDAILESNRAEELEDRTDDLNKIIDALYANKYQVIEPESLLNTFEKIVELSLSYDNVIRERMKSELIQEIN